MMNITIVQEEAKLDAMQRMWQAGRRMLSSDALFEDSTLSKDVFQATDEISKEVAGLSTFSSVQQVPPTFTCSDIESDTETDYFQDQEQLCAALIKPIKKYIVLDASTLGDLPARYTIPSIESHQFPVVGVYVDKRVIPGFKYRVRPLPSMSRQDFEMPYLFKGRALTLKSIGRGYSRRFTFEADSNSLNNNENYFWSDSRPEGFCFELEVVSAGDKFTVYDMNTEAQGTLEVLQVEGAQREINSKVTIDGIEKRAIVNFTGKVEFYETGVAKPMLFSGTTISLKNKTNSTAQISKIVNLAINQKRKGFTLTPGIQKDVRRVTVRGIDIRDVPTKYTMTGLQPYEQPVVGTYVDPRIMTGFHYRVRPNDRKGHLFQGRALKLCSIGMGYAKKLTFQPDSLVSPDNYLWSDNHPDGLGLEPRAVHIGMKFSIFANRQRLGEASVFRVDMPQIEERMEKIPLMSGKVAIVKYIHVNVMCHIKLATTGGGTVDNEEHLMRVYGLAVVRKEPDMNEAQIVRVENVALDSQLNLIFARTHTELTFHPLVMEGR